MLVIAIIHTHMSHVLRMHNIHALSHPNSPPAPPQIHALHEELDYTHAHYQKMIESVAGPGACLRLSLSCACLYLQLYSTC